MDFNLATVFLIALAPSLGRLAATRALSLTVRRQAEALALSDVFLELTVIFLACMGFAALIAQALERARWGARVIERPSGH